MAGFVFWGGIQAPVGLVKDIVTKYRLVNFDKSESDITFPSEISIIYCDDTGNYLNYSDVPEQSRLQLFIDKLGRGRMENLKLCQTTKGEFLFKYGTKNLVFGRFNDLYIIKNDEPKKIKSLGGFIDLYKDSKENIYFEMLIDNKTIWYEFDGKETDKIRKFSTDRVNILCTNETKPDTECAYIDLYYEFKNQKQ